MSGPAGAVFPSNTPASTPETSRTAASIPTRRRLTRIRLLLRHRRNPRADTAIGAFRELSTPEAIPEAVRQECRHEWRDAEGMGAVPTLPVTAARREELDA